MFSPDTSRPTKRLVLVLFMATGLMSASYGVMFTVLGDFRDTYGLSESGVGAIVSAGFFTSFFAQIFLSPLGDRGHAKRLVVGGLTMCVVGTAAMAFVDTLPSFLAARVVMGVGLGLAIPSLRRILVLVDPQDVGANFGRVISIDVAGFTLGPVISALTVDSFGLKAPFLIVAVALAVLLAPLVLASVPEGNPEDAPELFALDLLREKAIAAAVLLGVAFFVMIGTFDALWSVLMKDLDAPTWIAKGGIIVFAAPLVVLGPIGGRFAQRVGPYRSSTIGLLIAAALMLTYGLLPEPWMMIGFGVVHGINDGLTATGTGTAVGLVAPPERQSGAQGLLGGCQTLAGGLAALLAGSLYDRMSRATAYAACSALMVLLVLSGAILARRSGKWRVGIAGTEFATIG